MCSKDLPDVLFDLVTFSSINKVNIVYLFYYGLKAYILVNAHIYDGLLFGGEWGESIVCPGR